MPFLYVVEQGAVVRKSGDRFLVEAEVTGGLACESCSAAWVRPPWSLATPEASLAFPKPVGGRVFHLVCGNGERGMQRDGSMSLG